MIIFTYDTKYNNKIYNVAKEEIESSINHSYLDKLNQYEYDLNIQMLPKSVFVKLRCAAQSTPKDRLVKLNFDEYCKYTILKNNNNNNQNFEIQELHSRIFNNLHHEMQHIINHIEYQGVFDYIETMDAYGYIKFGISLLFDEYNACYYAQKNFFRKTGGLDGALADFCDRRKRKLEIIGKVNLYIDIITILAYSVAESRVLSELEKDTDSFNIALQDKKLEDFTEIFINIRDLLNNFSIFKYKEYALLCEIQIINLLALLDIDIEFLKLIDKA